MGAGQANSQWTRNPHRHPAAGRMGNNNPQDRLIDMDADGVDVEILYCGAQRVPVPLPLGSVEAGNAATRAFNDALTAWSADPKRLVVSYQIPIHDIDAAVAEVRARRRRWVASRCSSRCSRPRSACPTTIDERYDPLWSIIHETDLPICCHIGPEHVAQRAWRSATPHPSAGSWSRWCRSSTGEALGHVDDGRHPRAVPRPQGRVRRARRSAGSRGTSTSSTTWRRARATSSRRSPSCRASTSTAMCTSRSSRSRCGATDARYRPRRRATSCGRPTTRTRCRAGRTRNRSSRISSADCRKRSAISSSVATPSACGISEPNQHNPRGKSAWISVEKSRSSPVPRTESGRRRRGSSRSSARPWWWPTSTRRTGRPSPVSWATRARSRSSTSPASPATSSSTTRRSRSRVGSTSCT